MTIRHIPVLLAEVLSALAPERGESFIDGTFGAGGYTRAILERADCRVLAIDRDPSALAAGAALVAEMTPRLTLAAGRYGDLDTIAASCGFAGVDGVVIDIGVSSMQIDEAERGFSFMADGPLDMRMGAAPGTTPTEDTASAAELVNDLAEEDLANLLFDLGEERRSRAVARAIGRARAEAPITRTRQLADIVSRALGGRRDEATHPATRTFQALRIAVNDELGELARGLAAAEAILRPGGRLVAVTFHSLEDRIVKRFLAERTGRLPGGSRHLPVVPGAVRAPSFEIVNHKPLTASKEETDANPRSRSARLRAATRTPAAAHPLDPVALGVPIRRGRG